MRHRPSCPWDRTLLTALCLVLALGAEAGASDRPKEKQVPATEGMAKFEALVNEYNQAQQEFMISYRRADTDEQRKKLVEESYPRPDKYASRFLEVADQHPDDPGAYKALAWVATHTQTGDALDSALVRLREKHAQNESVKDVCFSLTYSMSKEAEPTLRAIAEKNPSREAQGVARLCLGQYLRNRAPDRQAEAERIFEEVAGQFGDVTVFDRSLGKMAEGELFEIRNLAIGKEAPEIEGEDVTRQRFKLSDYRGKVVVLDFFGDW